MSVQENIDVEIDQVEAKLQNAEWYNKKTLQARIVLYQGLKTFLALATERELLVERNRLQAAIAAKQKNLSLDYEFLHRKLWHVKDRLRELKAGQPVVQVPVVDEKDLEARWVLMAAVNPKTAPIRGLVDAVKYGEYLVEVSKASTDGAWLYAERVLRHFGKAGRPVIAYLLSHANNVFSSDEGGAALARLQAKVA